MRNKTSNIYTEWLPLIESLPNDQAGIVFKNILKYQNGEDIINDNPIWIFIKSKLDDYNNKGDEISEARKIAGQMGGLAKASKCYQKLAKPSKSSNKRKENKTKQNKIITKEEVKRFCKPSLQEIINYCNLKAYNIDPENFLNFYESKGWKVGNQPMKDWQACVRTWVKRDSSTCKQSLQVRKTTIQSNDDVFRNYLNKNGE